MLSKFHKLRGEVAFTNLVMNFSESILEWVKIGCKTVKEDEFKRRVGVCQDCKYWQIDWVFDLDRCNYCGCSSMKHWLLHSKCPIGKW